METIVIIVVTILLYIILTKLSKWKQERRNKELNSIRYKHKPIVRKVEHSEPSEKIDFQVPAFCYKGMFDYLPTINVKRGDVVMLPNGKTYYYDNEWIELNY